MADRNKKYVRALTFQMSGIVLAAINAKWIHPSLALRLLKANLGRLEQHCQILEFALRQPLKEKVEPVLAARPRILGLSVSIWNHLATLELLKALEERWGGEQPNQHTPGTNKKQAERPDDKKTAGWQKPFVVLGGPEVSWLPEDADIFRHADYVIRGEGENTFRELCESLLEHPPGGRPPEKFIEGSPAELDAIDPGYRLYSAEDLGQKFVYAETSRGCPFGCAFCLSSRDKTVRYFPLERFFAEMEILIEKGGRTFKFLDRTFNLDIDRAKRIMDFFLEKIENRRTGESPNAADGNRPIRVHFEMVPSRFPEPLKETIRLFPPGSLRIELGFQTFNPQTAFIIHRSGDPRSAGRQNMEELENLKFLRRETNALIHADLIAGLPGEDIASFGAGFDLLWQTLSESGFDKMESRPGEGAAGEPFEIQLGILKCLPGTSIIKHSEAFRMRYAQKPPYEVIETGAISAAGLEKIKNFARCWEIIVNRNPFPALLPGLLPPGKPVFDTFMALSGRLLGRFGRNWGIDREELRIFLEEEKERNPCT